MQKQTIIAIDKNSFDTNSDQIPSSASLEWTHRSRSTLKWIHCMSFSCSKYTPPKLNGFVYSMKGDYCPNKDTFWYDYYGMGNNQLSISQKLFITACHFV